MFGIFSKIKKLITVKSESKYCPTCDSKISHFNPIEESYWKIMDKYQCIHSPFQFETLNWLEYYCVNCTSNDRERLMALFFKNNEELFNKDKSWLELAPSKSFNNFIQSNLIGKYRTADLMMDGVDDKVDIQNMYIYEDNTFDCIICSHVLEHIPDDQKAVQELYRILKKDGVLIVLVPISLSLEYTLEDKEHKTEEERWKYYGQGDHLRMYSKKGFKNLFNNEGFSVQELGINYFGEKKFNDSGIHPRSILYVASKQS